MNPAKIGLLIFAALVTLIVPLAVAASTVTDYKARLESARFKTDELYQLIGKSDAGTEREIIAEIKTIVPASEKIEWAGGSVETGNAWLAPTLEKFTLETGAAERREILTGISERLLAISQAVGEVEKAAAASPTKDSDKQKLAEILRREQFQKPEANDESLFQKWKREFLEWLARVFPRPSVSPGISSGFGSLQFVLQILIYLLVIGLVGLVIYKFWPYISRRFVPGTKGERHDRVILGERIAAAESATDLFSEAERLAREGDLRLAIRKGYIALLCDLSDRKIVRLAAHKTNRDYLRDVRKNEGLSEHMTGLTMDFENNWYGLRSSGQADWEKFRALYRRAIAAAGS